MSLESLSDYFYNSFSYLYNNFFNFAIVIYFIKKYLDFFLNKTTDRLREKLKWETKIREQASSVAEHLALAGTLKETDSPELYRKANQLAYELALWLPADLYKAIGEGLSKNDTFKFIKTLTEVQKILLSDQHGDLNLEKYIISHSPGTGKN